ncbi:leucine-rich repeat domain-containing protein [Vibrio mangrovi]|nr:leucine-rich repeat domain-containing protein [Vibrio mangrovi]MDW6002481.1 leucine-rich repeat domain-containing protein [Vibrio mangrovi]
MAETQAQNSPDWQEALERIQQVRESGDTRLDLSSLDIPTLPDEITSLARQLTTLELRFCENLSSLQGVQSLRRLTSLNLTWCESLTILTEIESLTQLSELNLRGCDNLTSLSGIESLTQLTELNLSRSENLTSLTELNSLKQLTGLNLSRCENLTNLSGIESLQQLTELDLSWCENLTSLAGIESLHLLTQLNLSWCENLTSLSGIESLQQLTKLDLTDCNGLNDLESIQHLQQLTELDLSYCEKLTSLKGIESLQQLTELTLNGCSNLTSLQGLESLQQLVRLWLDDCKNLNDFEAIYQLEQLGNLSLEQLRFTDVNRFKCFQNLEVLYLNDNKLKDISPLSHLPNLQQLYLKNNAIQDVAQFRQFRQLEDIQLSGNPFARQYNLQLPSSSGDFLDNDLDTIQNLLFRLDDIRADIHLPAKVLFLGNHAAGKSSLVHYLQRGELSEQKDSTHILDIQPYQLDKPASGKKPGKRASTSRLPDALFYDFGGQDYYHGIYRVFMSQQAITYLLWHEESNHNRLEQDSCQRPNRHFTLNYWLGYWHHAHRDYQTLTTDVTKKTPAPTAVEPSQETNESPLVLIQTRADQTKACPIANTPATNQHFISLRAHENSRLQQTGLDYLQAQLDALIQDNQKTVPGATWYGEFLKKILKKHRLSPKNHWKSDAVQNWINDYKPTEPDRALRERHLKTEFSQLHEQGLVLYYPNINPDKVWLNPMAFAHYVHHKVLQQDQIEQDKGQVPESAFNSYDPDILKVLEQEKVIFLHQHGQPKYIIPNYLPLVNEDSAEYRLLTFGIQESFSFNLWFKNYLPLGLINQLICHFGNLPDDKKFWRDQLLFTLGRNHQPEGRTPSQVLIKLKFDDQLQVQVYLSNPDPEQRLLHTRYIYYVISSLYWDLKPCESISDFEPYYQEFQRTGQILLSQEQLQDSKGSQSRKSEHKSEIDSQKTAEFQRIYHAPPADLLISLNGRDFITATQLSRLKDETRLPSVQFSGEPSSGQKLIAVAPFSPFTHRRLHRMLKVFISYSHDDIDARRELQKYLINLERDGLIDIWQDGMINTGDDWHQSITGALEQADVVIMLVSQSFIASSYVHQVEMPKAMTLKEEGKAQIFPILLSQCDYQHWSIIPESVRTHITSGSGQQANSVPMGRFQFFPMNEEEQRLTPINRWQYPEDAWTQVANRLRALSKPA